MAFYDFTYRTTGGIVGTGNFYDYTVVDLTATVNARLLIAGQVQVIPLNGQLTQLINHGKGRDVVSELKNENGNTLNATVSKVDDNSIRIYSNIPLNGTITII